MIKINKKWYIDADKNEYILVKKYKAKNQKTGEEYIADKQISFHPTVSSALNNFIRLHHRKIVAEQELSLKEAIDQFKEIEQFILNTVNGNII